MNTRIPAHGRGMLRTGGTNRGGPGRLPSMIRERLRSSFYKRIKRLEDIADGNFVPRFPKGVTRADACVCGAYERAEPKKCTCTAATSPLMGMYAVADQLKAIDILAKYGLGTTITETDTEGRDVVIHVRREPRVPIADN